MEDGGDILVGDLLEARDGCVAGGDFEVGVLALEWVLADEGSDDFNGFCCCVVVVEEIVVEDLIFCGSFRIFVSVSIFIFLQCCLLSPFLLSSLDLLKKEPMLMVGVDVLFLFSLKTPKSACSLESEGLPQVAGDVGGVGDVGIVSSAPNSFRNDSP